MPETHEAQTEVEFVVPAPNVPMREGEERFKAGLNLEDSRRREAQIADLTKQLREISGTSAGEVQSRFARSPSARRRQQAVINKTRELKNLTVRHGDQWEGPCAPATIINLNPVPLQLYGQLQRFTMPAYDKSPLQVKLAFRGRTFTGSYLTVTTPEVWLKITGVNTEPTGDSPQMEAKYIPPFGLAHQFYSHYCEGAPDAQHMGGILIFEGDIHTLDSTHMKRSDRKVRMPIAEFSPDIPGEILYSAVPRALDEFLAEELNRQRGYAEAVIAQGHNFANSQADDIRNQLSNRHVTWHNYALECGYIEKAYPWASSRLQDSPLVKAVYCPDCRQRQSDPDQYFCANCNSPFDACKAFLAGKVVSADRLAVYDEDSEEFRAIRVEMNRRKARIAMLEGTDEPKAGKRKQDDKG